MTASGMVVCPNCGEENPAKFRLCGYCGTALAPALPPQEERKTVTIVFSDLKGSTNLGEALDPESLREVMTRYFDSMTAVLRRHGGTIEKFIGDAIMAVFGLPKLHEDDALRATRAAFEMTQALAHLNAELQATYGVELANRTGVNTGEVVAGDSTSGQRLVTGDAVNTAARLEQAAPTNEVLIGELTYRLVRDAVEVEAVEPLELKGKAERVAAWRLVSVSRAVEGFNRRQDAPMVGREKEMASLSELFAKAREVRGARMATVIADAGVGKSRLIREFVEVCDADTTVVRGKCLPYGEGITFWPLVDAARSAAGIEADDTPEAAIAKLRSLVEDDAVADRLSSAIGLSREQFAVPEIFWATRKFLEKLAADRTAVWVIDDIHWAEQTLLDLILYLLEEVEAPVLVLCSSRHDVLELHPDWALRPDSLRLVLQPLTDADAGQVVQNLLGKSGISTDVQERIVRAAEGNPLYVEQMLSMLIDSGQLREVEGRWQPAGDLSEMAIPPTIQALLSARLDRLGREERTVIEPASVIGLEFAVAAVEELSPEAVRSGVPTHLTSMSTKQLVRRAPSRNVEDVSYRFMHILIKDAAYNGLLKRARAQFHEKFAEWADRQNRARDRSQEYEEILGYHLEQAYRYFGELGPLDDHGREIGVRASVLLASAGRRAQARGDTPAAANLLRRAAATRTFDDPERMALLPDLGEALMELGEFSEAERVLKEAIEAARSIGDERLEAEANLVYLVVQLYSADTGDWSSVVMAEVERVIPIFERAGDDAGLALAWRLRSGSAGTAGQYGEAAVANEQVIEHATKAGDFRLQTRGMTGYAVATVYGPTPVEEAVARCEELAERAAADRRTVAIIHAALAQLYAMEGQFERARGMYAGTRAMLEELGRGVLAASTSLDSSRVELLAGDLAAAERELRRDYGALTGMGEKFLLSTVAALLGRVVELQGRHEEAERLIAEVEEIAAEDDIDAQALWRGVRARLLSARGEHEAAEALAREAVELRRRTDSLTLQAEALSDLAIVLRETGRTEEAAVAVEEALAAVEQKGDIVSAERLRSLRSQLSTT